ncbi:hypothetical protein [Streptomyces sp. MAA16]|nr:hypothetical protein [Streptomyces sp. MAA16]MDH6703220.1 hypothetical protein [Streptomyces sp. MAA16]
MRSVYRWEPPMDALSARLHAALCPEPPTAVAVTGEIRVPLNRWASEARHPFTQLAGALGYVCEVPGPRALEVLG